MFYSLRGTLMLTGADFAVVCCGGVSFKCLTTRTTLQSLPRVGEEATLYTYLNVREDALDLFGFESEQELHCFKLLIAVSGVGPKAALAVLGELPPARFLLCVAGGDAKSITRAPGVGPKIAQRIILELKDKLPAFSDAGLVAEPEVSSAPAGDSTSEAVAALTALGFPTPVAAEAVGKLDQSLPVEELVRLALKSLARQ